MVMRYSEIDKYVEMLWASPSYAEAVCLDILATATVAADEWFARWKTVARNALWDVPITDGKETAE